MADMMMPSAPQGQMPAQAPQGAPAPQAPPTLDQVSAAYDKLKAGQQMLDKVRKGLDTLVKLGDTISQEDVIKVAGKLVAAGLTPEGMATLLSEMPEKSEMLQEWIAKHDQDVTQREQQLNQMTDQYRHQMGAMAMEQLVAQHPADQAQAAAQMPAPQAEGTAPSDAGAMGLGG
jgi:hypothetical protein